MEKTFKYKGWLCEYNKEDGYYYLYTPDEMEQPRGFRNHEIEVGTKEFAKKFIDKY